MAVELLREDGIEIAGKKTRSVFDLHRQGRPFDYVIAVCSPEAKEACPIFPAERERLHCRSRIPPRHRAASCRR